MLEDVSIKEGNLRYTSPSFDSTFWVHAGPSRSVTWKQGKEHVWSPHLPFASSYSIQRHSHRKVPKRGVKNPWMLVLFWAPGKSDKVLIDASYPMQDKPAWQTHQAIWRGLAYPFSITIIPWRGKNAWVLCVRFFLLWTAFSPANMSSGMVAITRKSIFSWQCGLCQGALWKDLVEHGVPAARDTCPPLSFRWLFQTSLCSPGNLGKMSLGCLFYLFSYLACVNRHELTWAAIFRHFPF